MDLCLYNKKLHFDEDYLKSARLYFFIHENAIKCSENLLEFYLKIGTLHDVLEFCQQYKNKIYSNYQNSIVEYTNSLFGKDLINNASINDEYEPYLGNFESTVSLILNKYLVISEETITNKIQSSLKKMLFSEIQEKPQLTKSTAEQMINAYNEKLTIDQVNLVFNSLNAPLKTTEITPKTKALLNEAANITAFKKAIYTDFKNIIYPVKSLLKKNDGFNFCYDDANYLKAQSIINSLENTELENESLQVEIFNLIQLSPIDPKSYALPYYITGDDSKELETIAEILSIDIDFKSLKAGEQNAKQFLGDSFEEVENILSNNFFYKQTRDLLGKPLAILIHECKLLFNGNLQKKLITSVEKVKDYRFNEYVAQFGCFDITEENPLLILDLSVNNNLKDGMILTDKHIYFYTGIILPIQDIGLIRYIEKGFVLGELTTYSDYYFFDNEDIKELHEFNAFLNQIIKYYFTFTEESPNLYISRTEEEITSDYIKYAQKLMSIFYDKDLTSSILIYSEDPIIKKRFNNAISAYAKLEEYEVPLLCYDNTALNNSKGGCLVTNLGIHVHNSFSKPQSFMFENIDYIWVKDTSSPEIAINNSILQTTMLTQNITKIRFCLILNNLRIYFLNQKNYKDVTKIDNTTTNLLDLMKKISDMCSSNLIIERNVLLYSTKPKTLKKFENVIEAYASLEPNEIPFLCYDNTVFGSAKEGCLLTNTGIFIHNSFSAPKKIYYNEISTISLSQNTSGDILINDNELYTTTLSTYEAKNILVKIITLFVKYFQIYLGNSH